MSALRPSFSLVVLALVLGLSACNKEIENPNPPPTSPSPGLTVAPATLPAFQGRVGAASEAQSFTVSGTALTDRISATAPAGYELALAPAGPFAATVSVGAVAGVIVVVYVRLAATPAAGTHAGSIEVSSPGSSPRSVAVTGTVAATLPPTSSAPALTGFLPASGAVGTVLTLTGTNFTGATAVTFNGTNLPGFTVVSASVITVTIPGSISPSTGNLTVVTPTGTATSATAFVVGLPGPATLRTGTMMSQGGVPSSGTLAIERDAAGAEFVRFDASFRTDFHTGSLGVYLAMSSAAIRSQRTANPANVLRVGTITRDGAQTLAIPGSATGFTHVIIHCDPAMYNFGAALLQ
jgi:hypothetical protein